MTVTDEEYRDRTRSRMAAVQAELGFVADVPDYGLIQRVSDGAFVEVWLWIPNEETKSMDGSSLSA